MQKDALRIQKRNLNSFGNSRGAYTPMTRPRPNVSTTTVLLLQNAPQSVSFSILTLPTVSLTISSDWEKCTLRYLAYTELHSAH